MTPRQTVRGFAAEPIRTVVLVAPPEGYPLGQHKVSTLGPEVARDWPRDSGTVEAASPPDSGRQPRPRHISPRASEVRREVEASSSQLRRPGVRILQLHQNREEPQVVADRRLLAFPGSSTAPLAAVVAHDTRLCRGRAAGELNLLLILCCPERATPFALAPIERGNACSPCWTHGGFAVSWCRPGLAEDLPGVCSEQALGQGLKNRARQHVGLGEFLENADPKVIESLARHQSGGRAG